MKKTIIVNENNPIKTKYLEKLQLIKINEDEEIYLEEETYKNFLNLKKYMNKCDININIERAFSKENLTSDLSSGLSIIINVEESTTEKINMLHKNLSNYGFIVRYPINKEKITNKKYNPYHIRYVGKFIAKIIYDNNYCLEEYVKSFCAIIYINKEKGMTSFDVVEQISKLFGIKRVGHTGTLDPLATGVLIIAVGQATKIVELLTSTYKEYIAEVKMGLKTDTYDIEGKILDSQEIKEHVEINEYLSHFKKTYMQEVPIYSAVKVNGKKLYDYARNNEQVTLPKKEVTIKEIKLLHQEKDTFTFSTIVSKGCYIRSLINDIGNYANIYMTMINLQRTKQGKISISETNEIKDINNESIQLHKIEDVIDFPVIKVNKELEKKIKNGQKLKNIFNIRDKVLFQNEMNKNIGIYQNIKDELRVWKNFIN